MSDALDHDKTPTAGRRRYNKLAAASAVTAVAGAGVLLFAFNASSANAVANYPKITICHRTDSNTNPYVVITPNANSIVKFDKDIIAGKGHGGHNGPIWNPTLKAQHIKWGDIIPSFSYPGGTYPGKNWTAAGQAIYNNGCKILQAPPTTTSVVSSSVEASSTSASTTAASSTAESSGVAPTSEVNTSAVPVVTVTETAGAGQAPASETAPLPNAVGAGRHTTASSQDVALGGALMVIGLGGLASAVRPWKRGSH